IGASLRGKAARVKSLAPRAALYAVAGRAHEWKAPACSRRVAAHGASELVLRSAASRPAAMYFVAWVFLHQLAGDTVGPAEAVLQWLFAAAGLVGALP